MGPNSSADDLVNLEAASRILLSPLAYPGVDAWRRDCMQATRRLMGAECAMFALPGAPEYLLADNVDRVQMRRYSDFITAVWSGSGASFDPIVAACCEASLPEGGFAWDMHFLYRILGRRYRRSAYFKEIIVPMRAMDCCNLFVPTRGGSAFLSCWGLSGAESGGESLPLLRVLLPSLAAGVEILGRSYAHRQALAADALLADVRMAVPGQGAPAFPAADELRRRYHLTRREAEVAVLLAGGISNDAIAERLYLSPHTARRHTANIFEKLEVNSRKAVAPRFFEG